jgi:AAHS family 4-hydroxybenzoate transporter-like MFS transporter
MTTRIDGFRQTLDSEPVTPFFYGVIGLLFLLLLTDGFGTQSMGFVAPVITKAWALKKGAITAAVTSGLVGVMVGACTVTPVADKIGARRILVACALSYGVLLMATALVKDLNGLAWMRLLTGLALGGAMPAGIAIVSEYSPTRLRAMLVTVAVCGFSVGGALGGLANTFLIERHGWQSVFVAGGIVPILLAPMLYLWLPESLPRVVIGKASARAMAAVRRIAPRWSPSADAPAEAPVSHIPVVGLFQDGFAVPTVLIWVLYFMNLMVLYTLSSWLPTIVTDAGMSLNTANAATSFYQLGGIAGALVFSYACDRFGPRLILPAIFIGTSVFCFLIGLAGRDPGLVIGAATTAGVFVIGAQAVANAFVGNFYGSHIRATGIGWALGMGRLGAIVGPFVIGTLHGAGATPQTLFQLCAIPGLFAAAATWFVARNRRPAPAEPIVADAAGAKA